MTDLRTRLIALLTEARIVSECRIMDDGYVSVFIRSDAEAAEVAADAVIRELGLRIEVDEKASFRMEPARRRYVTEWETDDE